MRVADESYDGFILPHSSLLIFTASVSLAFKVACSRSRQSRLAREPDIWHAVVGWVLVAHLHVLNFGLLRLVTSVRPPLHLGCLGCDVLRLCDEHNVVSERKMTGYAVLSMRNSTRSVNASLASARLFTERTLSSE